MPLDPPLLTALLQSCPDVASLLLLYTRHCPYVDHINVAAALHRLAVLEAARARTGRRRRQRQQQQKGVGLKGSGGGRDGSSSGQVVASPEARAAVVGGSGPALDLDPDLGSSAREGREGAPAAATAATATVMLLLGMLQSDAEMHTEVG